MTHLTVTLLAQTIASGLMIGLIYALIAIGLTLIFGVMDIVNFAHGSFTMLGAYLAWSLTERLGQAGWPGGAAGFLLAALAADRVALTEFARRAGRAVRLRADRALSPCGWRLDAG